MLATQLHGAPGASRPLLIVPGLFGSARKWGVLAKRLSDTRLVIAAYMRNLGSSPWSDRHSYPDLAEDLAEVITAHGGAADVIGHSMGGKAAMVLALQHAPLVGRLIVADIAPVAYGHSQMQYLEAMRALDLAGVTTRTQADRRLQARVPEMAIRAFLLQSLDVAAGRWRLNLDALAAQMDKILGFPEVEGTFDRPTLFLSGGGSDYVLPDHRATIRGLFPLAQLVKIPGAGHWLHAEKPREFEAAARAFLDADA